MSLAIHTLTATDVAYDAANDTGLGALLARPKLESSQALAETVSQIIASVRAGGDRAVSDFGQRFDAHPAEALWASETEISQAKYKLDDDLIDAIDTAIATIEKFHALGLPTSYTTETAPGVTCQAQWRALDAVGLYVPAGSAPLPSTAIMLGVPARLAGCRQVVLATPPGADGRADPAVLMIAERLGISQVLVAGGAQAVAAMAYGTETVPPVVKIFGPGNRFVTEAKRQVSLDIDGAAMDMPAGPSEVMVLADDSADAQFVAADLLSQAEHGPDSQALLVTDSRALAEAVAGQIDALLPKLARADIATTALTHARALVVPSIDQALAVANRYAPEHLILASDRAEDWVAKITTAGSVFVGHNTPEALGDYISGTNHVLPTGGWSKVYAGLSAADFMRRMTVQQATVAGIAALGPKGARLAQHEGLGAHQLAIELRINKPRGGS
jgi:histidinol dehydrogenase